MVPVSFLRCERSEPLRAQLDFACELGITEVLLRRSRGSTRKVVIAIWRSRSGKNSTAFARGRSGKNAAAINRIFLTYM